MFELPPRLTGDEQSQLAALRDYLVRLATSLEPAMSATAVTVVKEAAASPSGAARSLAGTISAEEKQRIAELRSLIVKTADIVTHYADEKVENLSSVYVAQSDFGNYKEAAQAQFKETADGVRENYNRIEELSTSTGDWMKTMRGQICRGWLEDPDRPGEKILGIAISDSLNVLEGEGHEHSDGGQTYYEIAGDQKFGMYTASGWQFWVNGTRIGWFNSGDRMLHVPQLAVESSIQLGAGWILTATGGFGLRKLEA